MGFWASLEGFKFVFIGWVKYVLPPDVRMMHFETVLVNRVWRWQR
jgi:hypothetical protein